MQHKERPSVHYVWAQVGRTDRHTQGLGTESAMATTLDKLTGGPGTGKIQWAGGQSKRNVETVALAKHQRRKVTRMLG